MENHRNIFHLFEIFSRNSQAQFHAIAIDCLHFVQNIRIKRSNFIEELKNSWINNYWWLPKLLRNLPNAPTTFWFSPVNFFLSCFWSKRKFSLCPCMTSKVFLSKISWKVKKCQQSKMNLLISILPHKSSATRQKNLFLTVKTLDRIFLSHCNTAWFNITTNHNYFETILKF